jgi:hypothetical protein
MRAWLKNAVEVILWYWIGRPTSKMTRRYAEQAAKLPLNPKPGRTIL